MSDTDKIEEIIEKLRGETDGKKSKNQLKLDVGSAINALREIEHGMTYSGLIRILVIALKRAILNSQCEQGENLALVNDLPSNLRELYEALEEAEKKLILV